MPAIRLVGLLLMLAVGILTTILAWWANGLFWLGAFWGYVFLAATVLTWRRPLLGGSLAIGVTVPVLIAAFPLIIMNYDGTLFIGLILLAIALVFLGGAIAVLKTVRRVDQQEAGNPD